MAKPKRLIGKLEVLDRVGVSFATLWAWQVAGTFPRGREVGGKTMWFEHEVDKWLDDRPVRRLKGDPEPVARR